MLSPDLPAGPGSSETAEATFALPALGWDDYFSAAFEMVAHSTRGLLPGRIARVDRGRCEVLTERGTLRAATHEVVSTDPTAVACTGDWAALRQEPDGAWTVHALLPRRSAFLRSGSSKASRGQVLAANVDLALIAVPLAGDLVLGRLERFVALAWAGGTQPVVVLTKADLAADVDHLRADAEAVAPGVQVLPVSARTGAGTAALAALVDGGTAVLLGVSGAGKSTLANALTGDDGQLVQEVRDQDGKGRHTTTTRDLLPLPGGGVLIDTPGLRGVGLWDAEDGVNRVFAEIEELAARCRFGDCGHNGEPGCAVLGAVEDGSLPERRLESYRKLLRENTYIAARTDARLRAEMRQEWKRRSAIGRHHAERKYGPGGREPRQNGW